MNSINMGNTRMKTRKLTGLALLTAVVVVLQIICTFIHFGPFSITLALAPMIVGAAIYGLGSGALLGGVFGLVVLITGLMGLDGGTVNLLMGMNPIATIAICILKGAAAGAVAGYVYKLLENKNQLVAVICAGIVCPIVNTGLFILGMLLFFNDTLVSWAGGSPLLSYIILVLCGLNFLVELGTNLVLSTAITRIIRIAKK